MRALLVDDEELVLEGLDAFLQVSLPDLTLDKTSELAVARELAANVRYSLVLLDWHLVDADFNHLNARTVIDALRASGSKIPILIVSGDDPAAWPQRVFELGLAGFVPKRASGATLVQAIRTAIGGGIFLPNYLLSSKCGTAKEVANTNEDAFAAGLGDLRRRFPELTDRQAEVFRIMVRGASDKEIARELDIGLNTVRTHVRAVLGAVGAMRRGEAVFKAVSGKRP